MVAGRIADRARRRPGERERELVDLRRAAGWFRSGAGRPRAGVAPVRLVSGRNAFADHLQQCRRPRRRRTLSLARSLHRVRVDSRLLAYPRHPHNEHGGRPLVDRGGRQRSAADRPECVWRRALTGWTATRVRPAGRDRRHRPRRPSPARPWPLERRRVRPAHAIRAELVAGRHEDPLLVGRQGHGRRRSLGPGAGAHRRPR